MSASRPFADTNVVLYLLSADVAKAAIAEAVLLERPVISVQVLNEFTSVARRKRAMNWPEIEEVLATVQSLCDVEALTIETHNTAREIAQRYQLNFYDASIAAAALLAGCDELLSEDMHSGLTIERKLRVRNPFAS